MPELLKKFENALICKLNGNMVPPIEFMESFSDMLGSVDVDPTIGDAMRRGMFLILKARSK